MVGNGILLAKVLNIGSVAWEEEAVVLAAGDGGSEKKIGGVQW